jgi:predicted metal-dependent phosphoesterase TrpH
VKCDLHVHSVHSGPCTTPVLRHFCRESYSDPSELYLRLKSRGMDLVTVTDHDSIGALDDLRRYPDFFISEEVTARMPSGTEVHIGVYDITERQHVEIQRHRDDMLSLLMYLTEKRIYYVLNHAFSDLTGRRDPEDFLWFATYFPAMETRNSLMPPAVNRWAQRFADSQGICATGGSDAHAIVSAGTAYTQVPGACNKEEFFAGLRAGHGIPRGPRGTLPGRWLKLTRDICLVTAALMRDNRAAVALAPVAALIPAFTVVQTLHSVVFAWWWGGRVQRLSQSNWMSLPLEPDASAEVLAWP